MEILTKILLIIIGLMFVALYLLIKRLIKDGKGLLVPHLNGEY